MKVYVATPKNLSQAMYRVANALERYAPDHIQIVQQEDDADLLVLHVIGLEAVQYRLDKRIAVIQYCTGSRERTQENMAPWFPLWDRSICTWSYYDLGEFIHTMFYHAPLGIDSPFRAGFTERQREFMVMTSGYVNGMPQEAIEEPTVAAMAVGGKPIHLGKIPVGLTKPIDLNLLHSPGDTTLADYYRRCKWIAGLRYVEGFEMGVIEGLACGARPIVFNRPDNSFWFEDHVEYVEECTGEALGAQLVELFTHEPIGVTANERAEVLKKFNWKTLVTGFWDRVTQEQEPCI